jgi:hypothetical protein
VAGAISGDAIAGFSGAEDRGGSLCGANGRRAGDHEEWMRLQKRRVGDGRVRAGFRDDVDSRGDVAHFYGRRTVMFAVTAAAGGQLFVSGSSGERGRHQRKAEDEHQQCCACASHELTLTGAWGPAMAEAGAIEDDEGILLR